MEAGSVFPPNTHLPVTNFDRNKRSFGAEVAAALVSAVVSEIIGVSIQSLNSNYQNYMFSPSIGICQWFGSAPICLGICPASYETIRRHYGRSWYVLSDIPDEEYGSSCWTGSKTFCCKESKTDPTWAGHWISANDGEHVRCSFTNSPEAGPCGVLSCVKGLDGKRSSTYIEGDFCDQIDLFDLKGQAYPGYFHFYDKKGLSANAFYKTGS